MTGLDTAKAEILAALANTPLPAATDYVAEDAALQELPTAVEVSEHLFGGMPCQLGWCNGHNTYLNCLEYHRDSEFNLGTEDFVLLLARQEEIAGGKLDTAKVKAFRVPAGTLVEVYATTLHYAPCHVDAAKGFRVMTRSCGPATSGCSLIPTAPRPRPGRISVWWGKTYIFRSI